MLSTLRSSLAKSLGTLHCTEFKRFEMTTVRLASENDLESWVKKRFHDHDLTFKEDS